jgi:hypothetical protein
LKTRERPITADHLVRPDGRIALVRPHSPRIVVGTVLALFGREHRVAEVEVRGGVRRLTIVGAEGGAD